MQDNVINICNEIAITLIFISIFCLDFFGIKDSVKSIVGWIFIGLLIISFVVSLILAIKAAKNSKNNTHKKTQLVKVKTGKEKIIIKILKNTRNEPKLDKAKKEDAKINVPEESKKHKNNILLKKEETLSIVYKLNDLNKYQDQLGFSHFKS